MSKITKNEIDSSFLKNINTPYIITTGSANSYIATTDQITSYYDGLAICVKIHATSTGSSSLNINSLGAVTILDSLENNITANGLRKDIPYTLRFNGSNFIVKCKWVVETQL